jgi:hypothetical protein
VVRVGHRSPPKAVFLEGVESESWLTMRRKIRALIERWARAVHDGDMEGVVADHSDDIVMFDVPPPATVCGASRPIVRRGLPCSRGKSSAPRSRSSRSTSPRATTSPSRTHCYAAELKRNSTKTLTTACA